MARDKKPLWRQLLGVRSARHFGRVPVFGGFDRALPRSRGRLHRALTRRRGTCGRRLTVARRGDRGVKRGAGAGDGGVVLIFGILNPLVPSDSRWSNAGWFTWMVSPAASLE